MDDADGGGRSEGEDGRLRLVGHLSRERAGAIDRSYLVEGEGEGEGAR